jgi:hypothetical protein
VHGNHGAGGGVGDALPSPPTSFGIVASIPDSLQNWFYRDKRYEEGRAFGCSVRVGDLFRFQMAKS